MSEHARCAGLQSGRVEDYHPVATTALKKHGGEAHSTSASMKGACESPPVGFMLVLPLLFYTSTDPDGENGRIYC